jgi:hypothetical protein
LVEGTSGLINLIQSCFDYHELSSDIELWHFFLEEFEKWSEIDDADEGEALKQIKQDLLIGLLISTVLN